MADPVTAAEVLTVIEIVKEGAEAVQEVVKAVKALKDLVESFQKSPKGASEFQGAIEKAKQEIIARIDLAVLQAHQETLFLVSEFWYKEALVRLCQFPISDASIANRAQLKDIDRQIDDKKDKIKGMIFYITDPRNNIPLTPAMMNMVFIAYNLSINILVLHGLLTSNSTSQGTPTPSGTVIATIDEAIVRTKSFVAAHTRLRSNQIKVVAHKDGEGFFEFWGVASDTGGDTLLPNMAGQRSDTTHLILEAAWERSALGGTQLPALWSKWESLKTDANGITWA